MTPLTASTFFVDNSMIELMTTCPWLAYGSIIRRLRPAQESAALRYGGLLHRALAYRYRMRWLHGNTDDPKDLHRIEQTQIAALVKMFDSTTLDTEGWRNAGNAIKLIRAYNARYKNEPFKVATNPLTKFAYVEQPFAVDTKRTIRGRRIIYIGRIDLKVILGNGTYIIDHKTNSRLGDDFWLEQQTTGQHRGYLWADRECCGEEATGYYVNMLGCRESIANSEYDETLEMVIPNGAKSKAVPVELIRQPYFTKVPTGQLDEWFENMLNQVDTFLYQVDKGVFHRNYKHCVTKYGPCQFINVCTLPDETSRENALTSGAYQENTWTPLYV